MCDIKQKICKECGIGKNLSEYYVSIKEYGILHPRCKQCHNKFRNRNKVYKKTGFIKLDECVQNDIKEMIEKGEKIKKISEKHNIKYVTLIYWKKKGLIV